jgi:hypothetical protein
VSILLISLCSDFFSIKFQSANLRISITQYAESAAPRIVGKGESIDDYEISTNSSSVVYAVCTVGSKFDKLNYPYCETKERRRKNFIFVNQFLDK